MRKVRLVLALAAALGLAAITTPSRAEARWRGGGGYFPAVAGGLIAGAVISGIATSAYAHGPGYGYYGGYAPRYYGGYAPAYYGGYAPGYYGGYAPAYYGGYYGGYAPVVRYRRVVRPAHVYYGGPRYYRPYRVHYW